MLFLSWFLVWHPVDEEKTLKGMVKAEFSRSRKKQDASESDTGASSVSSEPPAESLPGSPEESGGNISPEIYKI